MASSQNKAPVGCLVIFALIAIGVVFLRSSLRSDSVNQDQCKNNLKQLHIALSNYEATYQSLPARITHDPEGIPLYSWRLDAMRYIHYDQEFNFLFDSERPWNSPENLDAPVHKLPWLACPNQKQEDPISSTSYFAVSDPTSVWEIHPYRLADIPDGPENTLLLIELDLPGVHWMQPKDVSLEELLTLLKDQGELPSAHEGVVSMCFADGSVYHFPQSEITSLFLRKIVSRDGGEVIWELENYWRPK